jgi:hypothetical protein
MKVRLYTLDLKSLTERPCKKLSLSIEAACIDFSQLSFGGKSGTSQINFVTSDVIKSASVYKSIDHDFLDVKLGISVSVDLTNLISVTCLKRVVPSGQAISLIKPRLFRRAIMEHFNSRRRKSQSP